MEGALIEIIFRTLCDPFSDTQAEAAYLFGQTSKNQESVFETGVDLIKRDRVDKLLIPDSPPRGGYPGYDVWYQALTAYGLDGSKIIGIPTGSYPNLNTLVEAQALVRYVQKKEVTKLFVVAAPFHQPRAFMTTVTIALGEFPELRIYNRVGTALPWNENVTHSQGTLRAPRSELIQHELERIERYQHKGDLAAADEILTYLNWRDS